MLLNELLIIEDIIKSIKKFETHSLSELLNYFGSLTFVLHNKVASSLEYLHHCHQSRRDIIILKSNFEKTFDKVEHDLIKIMEHKGFPDRWIAWMRLIFNSGISCHV